MPSDPDAPSRSQSANVSGADNVNVQIQGDNNVVHLGRSRLDLTLYRGRRRAVSSSAAEAGEAAEILSPYAMAVPLVGRERELADLWTWMNGDPDLSIRVITAPGGGGKTRLALELCEEAVRQGWHAGFVKASASLDSAAASLPRPNPRRGGLRGCPHPLAAEVAGRPRQLAAGRRQAAHPAPRTACRSQRRLVGGSLPERRVGRSRRRRWP